MVSPGEGGSVSLYPAKGSVCAKTVTHSTDPDHCCRGEGCQHFHDSVLYVYSDQYRTVMKLTTTLCRIETAIHIRFMQLQSHVVSIRLPAVNLVPCKLAQIIQQDPKLYPLDLNHIGYIAMGKSWGKQEKLGTGTAHAREV